MFGRKSSDKDSKPKATYRPIGERNGQRYDYVEIELKKPIKSAKPGITIAPPDKFE